MGNCNACCGNDKGDQIDIKSPVSKLELYTDNASIEWGYEEHYDVGLEERQINYQTSSMG